MSQARSIPSSVPETAAGHRAEALRTLQLAGPVIIGQLAGFGMNFVDTVMAGHLLDATALAAIAVGSQIWSAFLLLILGILLAVIPMVSQLDGAGRRHRAGAVLAQAAWLAGLLSLLMVLSVRNMEPLLNLLDAEAEVKPLAMGYLDALSWGAPGLCLGFALRFFFEGTGYTRMTMYIGLMGVGLNIPLNYLLMLGKFGLPELGVVGCGYATALVLCLQVVFMTLFVWRSRRYRPYQALRRWVWPRWRPIRELLVVGLPIGISIFFEGSLFIGAGLLIVQLGTTALAAHQIALNFASLTFMIPLGMASAITVRVGNAIGRGDPLMARYLGIAGILLALGFQSISSLIMLLMPHQVVGLYTHDVPVTELAVGLLFYAAIFQISDGIQVCAAGGLRGLKDTRVPMVLTVIAYWLVGMTTGYLLTFQMEMGPAGMWIGMIAGLTVAALLLTRRFLASSARHISAARTATLA